MRAFDVCVGIATHTESDSSVCVVLGTRDVKLQIQKGDYKMT